MTLLRARGQCARLCSLRSLTNTRHSSVRLAPFKRATCAQSQLLPTLYRERSDYAPAQAKTPAYRYPENLNVFNAGSFPTVTLGLMRVVTNVFFGYGVLWAAPSMFFDPEAPWYMVPTVAAGSAIPLLAAGLAFGGYVNHINILLPQHARKSKDDLTRFAAAMPPTTIVQLKSMWFRPWPVTKEIYFEDLRRLPRRWYRLANLEHVPHSNRELVKSNPMWNWIVGSVMGRYSVSAAQVKDRSRAPGVWERVWEQIPMAGEYPVPRETMKRPVVAANRAASAIKTAKGTPPRRPKLRNER